MRYLYINLNNNKVEIERDGECINLCYIKIQRAKTSEDGRGRPKRIE